MGDEEIRPFHDLRHSAVTALALEARHAFTLQQVAGHANIATTQATYGSPGVVSRTRRPRSSDVMVSRSPATSRKQE
jgi:integrase